jgi:hypothetical protein
LAAKHSTVELWQTTEAESFVHKGSVAVAAGGKVSITIAPESIYTLSSTTGQSKGGSTSAATSAAAAAAAAPPASAPFPSTYSDEFDEVATEGVAKYWADQCGSFQVMAALGKGGKGQALMQRTTEKPGVNKWASNLKQPLTVLGNWNMSDSTVSADLLILPGSGAKGSSFENGHHNRNNGTNGNYNERSAKDAFISSKLSTVEKMAAIAPAPAINDEGGLQYKLEPGRITGGQWDTSKPFTSLEDAEGFCTQTPQCAAFTFQNSAAVPTGKQLYWFTSLATVDPAGKGWQSYVVTPPRPKPPAPPPPPPSVPPLQGPWGGLCGRLSKAGIGVTTGVCIEVNGTQWLLVEKNNDGGRGGSSVSLGSGMLAAGAGAGWVSVQLQFAGQTVSASINGAQVANATPAAQRGMFAFESGWNEAQFDNFAFKP